MNSTRKHVSYLDTLWDCFCIATIAGIWPRFIEPNLLQKTHKTIPIKNLKKNLHGLKIVQFSDLHFSKSLPDAFLTKIRKSIEQEKPDLLVFTGDFLCYSCLEDEVRMQNFFLELPKACYGNFAVLGNHDYDAFVSIGGDGNYSVIDQSEGSTIQKGFKRMLKPVMPTGIMDPEISDVQLHKPLLQLLSNTPFTLLHNSVKKILIEDSILNVIGLGEYSAGKMDENYALKEMNPGDFTLTLLHNPDGVQHLRNHSDLILSGHTHGGQVNLPWLKSRFILMEDPSLCKGLVRFNNQWIYVSRGVGSVLPFRWFSPPEIVSITLERA